MSSIVPYGRSSAVRVADEDYARDLFLYTAEFLPLVASAADTRQIQIQADSDFLLAMITGTVKNLDADETVIADPAITVEFISSGSGRFLMDRPVPWSTVVGTAQRPYVVTTPKVFTGNSQITVNVVNFAVATKRVRITFHGYKLFSGLPANYGG